MDPNELADEMQRQYDRCKEFPEKKEGGWIAMIMLRNLAPAVIEVLRKVRR